MGNEMESLWCLSRPEEDVQIPPEPTDDWDPDSVKKKGLKQSLINFCF